MKRKADELSREEVRKRYISSRPSQFIEYLTLRPKAEEKVPSDTVASVLPPLPTQELKEELKEDQPPLNSSQRLLSDEQEEIAKCVLDLNNVQVISKAGSGKTTTSIEIASRFFDAYQRRTLILTYNTRLKLETRERISNMNLGVAMECHSYHAAACKFFSPSDFEPQEIDNGLLYNAIRHPARRPMDFGLLIIDEAQDMNDLYAKFVIHMLKNFSIPPVLMMLGDPFQRIFGFNGADCDYLLQPQKYFSQYIHPAPFLTRHMTICWRITHEMAEFINTKVNPNTLQFTSPDWWKTNGETISALWGNGIRANPKRPPAPGSVVYYTAKRFTEPRCVAEATSMFKMYGNDHVALLGSSLKTKSPISFCVDKLGKGDTENWIVLSSESEFKSEDHLFTGKRVASTIHKFKGLERKGILVCGMNDFIESRSTINPLDHFNLFYVACTRAKEKLVIQALIDGERKEYATIRASPLEFKSVTRTCTVTDLTNYVPFDTVLSVRDQLFETKEIYKSDKGFDLTTDDRLINGRAPGTQEDISAFIGSAVHAKMQLMLSGHLEPVQFDRKECDHDMYEWQETIFRTKRPVDFTWSELVQYAIVRETRSSRYRHYWRQIVPNIHNIKQDLLDRCLVNAITTLYHTVCIMTQTPPQTTDFYGMITFLKPMVTCEVPVVAPVPFDWFNEYNNLVQGSVDFMVQLSPTKKLVVELKVSNQLRLDHLLQVQMYTNMAKLWDGATEFVPAVILANRGESYNVTIDANINADFIYRMALRKTGQKFEPHLIK